MYNGFIKAAAAAPQLRVADPIYNAEKITAEIKRAKEKGVKLLLFPELSITGATCGHLFFQKQLQESAKKALKTISEATAETDMLVIVGMPLSAGGRLYNVAACLYDGELLGFVPRANTDGTVFSPAPSEITDVELDSETMAVMATDLLFAHEELSDLEVAVLFNADIKTPGAAAEVHCAAGALVLAVLSDEPMSVYSKKELINSISADTKKLRCAALYAAPGRGESTTDKVYSGLCAVAELGEVLAADEGTDSMAISEIDTELIIQTRQKEKPFYEADSLHGKVFWGAELSEIVLTRHYSKTPFIPENDFEDFCERALDIQAYGLIKRMEYTGLYRPVIGVSGGVDSTLVMLASARALDILGLPRKNIVAVTMPCFGTTGRTKSNAITIAEQLGADLKIKPIGESVKKHFEVIEHSMDDYSVVFENAQARERTMVLLNLANKLGGLNVGTKDLSEQADGWCTFNGDQISNYDINAGLTKTMVSAIVRYIAEKSEDKILAEALLDILDTPVTPELLPISEQGELLQKSEDSVGSYTLQDFYLYHMVKNGFEPKKVLRLAKHAFKEEYDNAELTKWLKSYTKRLFAQQFKRSTTADGPAAMGFTFSPRDGFKMPSDAQADIWMQSIAEF